MCKLRAVFLLCVVFILHNSYCYNFLKKYNLRGKAGQAYALEINVGDPYQKLNVIVDTGSTTLAIAAYPFSDLDTYFQSNKSKTLFDSGKKVQAKYSQGNWVGKMASDIIGFPDTQSILPIPNVRADIALITESHNFFMNGSGWQGLLGLAYLPVGARGEDVIVDSWLTSVEHTFLRPLSFELQLCGPFSPYNSTHFGNFELLNESSTFLNRLYYFHTPILRPRWYEVGVIAIRVLSNKNETRDNEPFDEEMCRILNQEKSIVDSGTTNIRLPDIVFRQIISEIRDAVQTANILILDEFWFHSEAACWEQPQTWKNLPYLAIDILSDVADDHYFTIKIPPQNYMRLVSSHNSSKERVSEFCYKLGIEAGGKETVLGYTAMEGFKVLFNRDSEWIGWAPGHCGFNTYVNGPHNACTSLIDLCHLDPPFPETEISIQAAQWTLLVISIVAFVVLVYLLLPCVKMLLVKKIQRTQQISLSQSETALVG